MLPAIVILLAGIVAPGFEQTSIVVVVSVLIGIGAAILAARRTSAFLLRSVEVVVVGLAPLWRTQLGIQDVSAVDRTGIDAYAEYGGWGDEEQRYAERERLFSVEVDTRCGRPPSTGRPSSRRSRVDARRSVLAIR